MELIEKLSKYGVSVLVENNAGRLPASVVKAAVLFVSIGSIT